VIPEFPSDNPDLWHLRPPVIESVIDAVAAMAEQIAEMSRMPPPVTVAPTPTRVEADDVEITVEVVEFDDADFAMAENESLPPPPPPPEQATEEADLFQRFVSTLVEVALAAGAATRVVGALPGMLGVTRLDVEALDATVIDALVASNLLARTSRGAVARSEALVQNAQAWRATLLGEETELVATAMLDEWAAHIVASLLQAPQQAETVRRDLRARGIAAFGMLVEAA
jgi:hypothetical protein